MTRFAVITNTDTHVKMIFATARITPTVAINDPVLMVGMPPALTAATGMDALTHAIEAYVAALANPVTDACALAAIKLVSEWLPQAVANGDNLAARDKMAYAEYLAGMAFNNAGIGIVHAMAHQPGALLNKPHGVCNAILLPHGCAFQPDRLSPEICRYRCCHGCKRYRSDDHGSCGKRCRSNSGSFPPP